MKKGNDFEYKYVAPTTAERKEIESIRDSYTVASSVSNPVSKLDYLRKLDSRVKNIPTVISLVIGIVSILIFGLGLTMILEWDLIVGGVILSAVATIPMVVNYLLYCHIATYLKNKYKDEILKLSNELLNDGNK